MEISEALLAQQQVARLQTLLEVSRQLHSTIELDEVLHIALQIVVRELELSGAFFTTWTHTYDDVLLASQEAVVSAARGAMTDLFGPVMRFPLFATNPALRSQKISHGS